MVKLKPGAGDQAMKDAVGQDQGLSQATSHRHSRSIAPGYRRCRRAPVTQLSMRRLCRLLRPTQQRGEVAAHGEGLA
jgi:hypothetical protein